MPRSPGSTRRPAGECHGACEALVALCVGAMVVARAVDDPKPGDGFRHAAREHVLAHTGWRDL